MKKYLILLLTLLIMCGKPILEFELGYEAKDMTNLNPEIVSMTDSCALFWGVGTIEQYFNIQADSAIVKIVAKQDKASTENAQMKIDFPDSSVIFDVFTEDWDIYQFRAFNIKPGRWQFSYINDIIGRRIYFDRIIIDYQEIEKDTINIGIVWNPNQEDDLAGYKIYYGNNSRSYQQKFKFNVIDTAILYIEDNFAIIKFKAYTDPASIQNDTLLVKETCITDTILRYLAITAYDTADNESDYSNEVVIKFIPQGNCRKGDFNCDGHIWIEDLEAFQNSFGCNYNDLCYNAIFDFDDDSTIYIDDLQSFEKVFGTKYEVNQ